MSSNPNDPNQDETSKSGSTSSWSSWFVSPSVLKERFQEFDDQQRIDRLSECRKLDKILHDCRKRNQPGKAKSRYTKNSPDNKTDDPIESISIGLRNMKYFGWRGILKTPAPTSPDTDTTNSKNQESEPSKTMETVRDGPDLSVFHPNIRSSCAREEHAVWACRAIATGCGKDLSELKKCFDDVDNTDSAQVPQHVRVLTAPYTNYQGIVESVAGDRAASMKRQIPCHEIQRKLGSCVTENGKQLLERKQQREGKQK